MSKKAVKLDSKGRRKFGIMDKLAYAAGDLGCNMSFGLKGTVQTFWLVYMTMETGLLSALLLLVQIWDAINDPIIGAMIDRDNGKYKRPFFNKIGKFKTYIFIGACGLLVAGAAVFLPFPNAPVVIKAMLFIVGYVLWDACYTLANVPYGSMLSLVTEDPGERAQLSSWRSIGGAVGNVLPGIILPMIIWKTKLDENGNEIMNPETGEPLKELLGGRVFFAALLMGLLGFVCFMFMIKKITIRVDENSVKAGEDAPKFNVAKAFKNFMKNRPAVGATIAAMGMFLGMQSATTANSIMFAVYFGKPEYSGVVMAIGFAPMFLFIPFIKKLVNKYGKQEAAIGGTAISLIGGFILLLFPLVDRSIALAVYMVGLVLFGLGLGVYSCISWAMMADAIDYAEWKFGKREEGTVYSLHSFFRKLAQGIGPSIVLLIMGWLGYIEKNQTAQTMEVAVRMCWLVAGLYLFSALVQLIGIGIVYNLDKKTLAQMNEELDARRNVKK